MRVRAGRLSDGVRTLVGGVGYPDLRDHSLGPVVAERLAGESWPDAVAVENLSYNPVAVVHRLGEVDPPFDRLVLVGAVARGRPAGTIVVYRWDGALPAAGEVQERVAEAVTGVIGLDNLVVVTAALGAAPPEVYVIEVEPEVEALGGALSPSVAAAAAEATRLARRLALAPRGVAVAPVAALGGATTRNGQAVPRGGRSEKRVG